MPVRHEARGTNFSGPLVATHPILQRLCLDCSRICASRTQLDIRFAPWVVCINEPGLTNQGCVLYVLKPIHFRTEGMNYKPWHVGFSWTDEWAYRSVSTGICPYNFLSTAKCRHKYLPERPKREVKLKDPSIRVGFNTGKAILLIAEYKHAQKEGPKIECYNIALTIYIA